MNPDLIVSSKTTIGTQLVVEMREDLIAGASCGFYSIYVNDSPLLSKAIRWRAQAFYTWLVSGSCCGSSPTIKSWLELGFAKDATQATPLLEQAISVVQLANAFCSLHLTFSDRHHAIPLIEAAIFTHLQHARHRA